MQDENLEELIATCFVIILSLLYILFIMTLPEVEFFTAATNVLAYFRRFSRRYQTNIRKTVESIARRDIIKVVVNRNFFNFFNHWKNQFHGSYQRTKAFVKFAATFDGQFAKVLEIFGCKSVEFIGHLDNNRLQLIKQKLELERLEDENRLARLISTLKLCYTRTTLLTHKENQVCS